MGTERTNRAGLMMSVDYADCGPTSEIPRVQKVPIADQGDVNLTPARVTSVTVRRLPAVALATAAKHPVVALLDHWSIEGSHV